MDSLRAGLALFEDDGIWTQNASALESLPPYCSACGNFGHLQRVCPVFQNRPRVEPSFLPAAEHALGTYVLKEEGVTVAGRRVVAVNDQRFEVGIATTALSIPYVSP